MEANTRNAPSLFVIFESFMNCLKLVSMDYQRKISKEVKEYIQPPVSIRYMFIFGRDKCGKQELSSELSKVL